MRGADAVHEEEGYGDARGEEEEEG